MIKHFCDWCGSECTDNGFEDPFPSTIDSEICESCYDLARRTFSGKHIMQVVATRTDGTEETNVRVILDHRGVR